MQHFQVILKQLSPPRFPLIKLHLELKTYYDITEHTNTSIVVRLSLLSELEDSVGWS